MGVCMGARVYCYELLMGVASIEAEEAVASSFLTRVTGVLDPRTCCVQCAFDLMTETGELG